MSGFDFMSTDYGCNYSCCRYVKSFASNDEGRSSETIGTIAWRKENKIVFYFLIF